MHPSALRNAERFFRLYGSRKIDRPLRLAEIGSQDVNGSLRQVCPPHIEYLGLDFVAGPGVDVVLDAPVPPAVRRSELRPRRLEQLPRALGDVMAHLAGNAPGHPPRGAQASTFSPKAIMPSMQKRHSRTPSDMHGLALDIGSQFSAQRLVCHEVHPSPEEVLEKELHAEIA